MAERTVASATNDDIDLAGVLTDALSVTITAAELIALVIINKQKDGTANTTNLTIGNGSDPMIGFLGGTTPTIGPIRPGGSSCWLRRMQRASAARSVSRNRRHSPRCEFIWRSGEIPDRRILARSA
ncbi:MAG: hypothetical protein U1E25_14580 [Methylocystis sp.]